MATVIDPTAELAQALGQVGETVQITVNRKPQEVTITPLRLRQLTNALKCVQRLREAGVVEDKAMKEAAAAESAEEAVKRFDILKMFLAGGDEIINIVIIASGLAAHVADNLDLPDAVRLVSAIFKVNVDFFFQNRHQIQEAFAPVADAISQMMGEGAGALGQPPSTDSEAQATA